MASSAHLAQPRIAFPERKRGPFRSIVVRICIVVAAISVVAVLTYINREGFRDNAEMGLDTFLDALYYATITLSTTGYGDVTPVSQGARALDVFLFTPLRFLTLILLVGTTIEVLTERSRQQFRYARWRRRVKKHTVVIGYGMKGRSAVQALKEQGISAESIVAVDTNGGNVKAATADGCIGVVGDARREEVLRRAAVPDAHRVIVAADRDDTNVLVVLTSRRLNPTCTIAAAVKEQQNIAVLRQGGADVVIPTAESAGRLLGLSIIAPKAGELMEDLLEPLAGLQISERDVSPEDIGLAPARLTARGEIVLTVVRGERSYRFDSGEVKVFQPGDRIVTIRATDTTTEGKAETEARDAGV